MYERFTDRARRVLQLANQEAQRFNHEFIGTEHVLMGLAKEGTGIAAHALAGHLIDLRKIRIEVEKINGAGPDNLLPQGKMPQTPRASKILEFAKEECLALHHNYVGTEHLLLGILRLGEECTAGKVILALGVKLEDMRNTVLECLKPQVDQPPAETGAPVWVASELHPCYAGEFPRKAGAITTQVERWLRVMLSIPANVDLKTVIVIGEQKQE